MFAGVRFYPLCSTLWLGCITAQYVSNGEPLSCHCKNDEACDPGNGYCANGCALGWTGAGCQIGNLAFKRQAYQSSDYYDAQGKLFGADFAVDGQLPPDSSDQFCSSTYIYNIDRKPWWYVSLGSASYIVSNVTIVNRRGNFAFRLQKFYVLLGNNTSGDPAVNSWSVCSYQESQPETVSTYVCKNVSAAQRVAIYLNEPHGGDLNVLTLCEVYVYGYKYSECDDQSMFGPGCLIQKCTSGSCKAAGGSCGPYDECLVNSCPGDRYLPPDCWITMPNLNDSAPTTLSGCEQIIINVSMSSKGKNVQATSMFLEYAQAQLTNPSSFSNNVSTTNTSALILNSFSGETYRFRVTPIVCTGSMCYKGVSSQVLEATAAERLFYAVEDDSCIKFTVNSSSTACSLPSSYFVNCTAENQKRYLLGNTSLACGLEPSVPYTCFVKAGLANGKLEVYATKFPSKHLEMPNNDVAQLTVADVSCNSANVKLSINIMPAFLAPQSVWLLAENGTSTSLLYQNEYLTYENATFPVNSSAIWSYKFRLECEFCANGSCQNLSKEVAAEGDHLMCGLPRPPPPPPPLDATIAGATIGTILLIAAIVLAAVFVLRMRRGSKSSVVRKESASRDQIIPRVVSSNGNSVEQVYANVTGLTFAEFVDYNKNEDFIIRKFKELPESEAYSTSAAKLPENKSRNRFQNILPYDRNRVILHSTEANAVPYINASYVDGFERGAQYIATQGPKESTIRDFWQMIWHLKSTVIIMLTNFIEGSKKKVDPYFPFESPDGLSVSEIAVHTYDAYRITELQLKKDGQVRNIHHAHFLTWSDHSVPQHCADVLMFRSKISSLSEKIGTEGPQVVHCSAGAGRTGAYIAIDILLERYHKTSRVDVDSCVLQLRGQRMHMVQTKEQYIFVHRAVLHGMRTSEYIIPAERLKHHCVSVLNNTNHPHLFAKEWQALTHCLPCTDDDFVNGTLPANMPKNRNIAIIARDSMRPFLQSGKESTDYINAVFCKGFRGPNEFLVTQMPLPNTVEDFWSMVFASQAKGLVLLHLPPAGDETCPSYIPPEASDMELTSFRVTCLRSIVARDTFPVKDLEIIKKGTLAVQEPTTLRMFCFDSWDPFEDLPNSAQRFLEFIKVVQIWMKNNDERPIVVHCLDGARHSGLFVAALNALDRLLDQGQTCVFHATELARISRPQFIVNEVQYKFLYEVLLQHQNDCAIYANT